jgi:hypothetical protein
MYLIAIAWIYVVLMMSVAEAMSSQGSVLGAVITFLRYGVLPLALVLYILGTPGRRRRLRARESSGSAQPDRGRHAPGDAVATEREEP